MLNTITWNTAQQLIRMGLNAGGMVLLGESIASGAEFQGAVGGAMSIVSFAWWLKWNRK